MVRLSKIRILALALLTGLLFASGCDKQNPQEGGFLIGKISIGPICPVERIPPDPGCLPTAETYKAYPVGVWTANGERKVAQLYPALDGSYKTPLQTGNYLVILETNRRGIGGSNLPAEVTIYSQDDTNLDINIDTGIR